MPAKLCCSNTVHSSERKVAGWNPSTIGTLSFYTLCLFPSGLFFKSELVKSRQINDKHPTAFLSANHGCDVRVFKPTGGGSENSRPARQLSLHGKICQKKNCIANQLVIAKQAKREPRILQISFYTLMSYRCNIGDV